jgi:hypothetical protein
VIGVSARPSMVPTLSARRKLARTDVAELGSGASASGVRRAVAD